MRRPANARLHRHHHPLPARPDPRLPGSTQTGPGTDAPGLPMRWLQDPAQAVGAEGPDPARSLGYAGGPRCLRALSSPYRSSWASVGSTTCGRRTGSAGTTNGARGATGGPVADWSVVNGSACYYCGSARCQCAQLEAEEDERMRYAHRTNRLMRAIDLAEAQIEALEGVREYQRALTDLRERLDNLTRALLNHRRVHHSEAF